MADARSKGAQAVLMATAAETEAAFYEALQRGDVDGLMRLWSDDEEVACVHPNGPRLVGQGAIRAAFAAVLAAGGVDIVPVHVRCVESPGCSVHHVLEKVQATTARGLQTAGHERVPAHPTRLADGGAPRQPWSERRDAGNDRSRHGASLSAAGTGEGANVHG